MSYVSESDWKPTDNIILEKTAYEVIKNQGNIQVMAGPGAGKTELLAQKACYLLQTNNCPHPKKLLAISFKRDAAKNLMERVEKRCGKELARRFTSLTYDAFAKRILDQFKYALPNEYQPSSQYDVLTNYTEIRDSFEQTEQSVFNKYQPWQLTEAFDELKIPLNQSPKTDIENAANNVFKLFFNGNLCKVTFRTITKLVIHMIELNPIIKKALLMTYDHVFLDEFQDTTTLQYALIRSCFYKSNVRMTAVGDVKQSIMRWAGAEKEIASRFTKDYKASNVKLLINHRSAPRLIQLQKAFSGQITPDDEGKIKSSKRWKPKDGVCEIWNYQNPSKESTDLAENIKKWMTVEKKHPREICILVRQRPEQYTDQLISKLKTKGVIARNESHIQDMLTEDAIQVIVDFMYIVLDKKATQEWIRIIELLKYFNGIIGNENAADIKVQLLEKELSDTIQKAKAALEKVNDKKVLVKYLKNIIEKFDEKVFKNYFPQYRRSNYLSKLISDVAEYIWKEYEEYNNWLEAIKAFRGDFSIPIMTVHKSKGLEYDTVVFVGLEDSALWNFNRNQDEETCTIFVALSRAKQRVIFTFSNVRNTGWNNSSKSQSKNNIGPLYALLSDSGIVEEFDK